MKKSQNFTTLKQSQRLLELGVPADSADMYFQNGQTRPIVRFANSEGFFERNDDCSPCWSVGQLIDIFEICTGLTWQNEIIDGYSKIDMLLEDFDDRENKYCFDFLKLEE